jgi:protein BUR2
MPVTTDPVAPLPSSSTTTTASSKQRPGNAQLPTPPHTRGDKMSEPSSSNSEWESQWLFTEEELLQTPSVLDGISPETEREQRSKGCNFITQLGIQLKLPQLTLATASTYLHRFYMQNSLKRHHYYETAATALFLATKVEENMRKFGEIVAACVRAAQKNLKMEVHRDDKEFWRWKDCILSKEEYLLESICFDVSVEVPYNHLLNYTAMLGVQTRQLMRTAWTFLNDAQLTMLCILYPPRTIAAAALYCAAKHCNIEFPDQDDKPWWDVIGVKIKEIKKCCNYMALVYEYVLSPPPTTHWAGLTSKAGTTRSRAMTAQNMSPPPRAAQKLPRPASAPRASPPRSHPSAPPPENALETRPTCWMAPKT